MHRTASPPLVSTMSAIVLSLEQAVDSSRVSSPIRHSVSTSTKSPIDDTRMSECVLGQQHRMYRLQQTPTQLLCDNAISWSIQLLGSQERERERERDTITHCCTRVTWFSSSGSVGSMLVKWYSSILRPVMSNTPSGRMCARPCNPQIASILASVRCKDCSIR